MQYVLNNPITNRSIEYNDNRISRLCASYSKCEISGNRLEVGNMECHHKIPLHLGGNDEYNNLIWVDKSIHKLIHATKNNTIKKYLNVINLDSKAIKKLNLLRVKAGNKPL